MQTPLALGNGQRICGQCEMVHAHIHIARAHEGINRARQHIELVLPHGQIRRLNAALRLEALGQMRIGVERNTVRAQRIDLLQRACKRCGRLFGQAVDQIDVDGDKAQFTRFFNQCKNLLGRLFTVHRLLHIGVKVLHAKAQAVEAHFLECQQTLVAHGARVHFNGIFARWVQLEMLTHQRHQLAQFVITEKSGCTAAQVQLADQLALAAVRGVHGHFAAQIFEILRSFFVVLGHDLVAGAVVAQRLAKRHMHIDRQRQCPGGGMGFSLLQCQNVVVSTESLNKTVGCWERGVAGPRDIKSA